MDFEKIEKADLTQFSIGELAATYDYLTLLEDEWPKAEKSLRQNGSQLTKLHLTAAMGRIQMEMLKRPAEMVTYILEDME